MDREREMFFFLLKIFQKFGNTVNRYRIGEKIRTRKRKKEKEKERMELLQQGGEGGSWHLNEEREYKGHLVKFEVVQAL